MKYFSIIVVLLLLHRGTPLPEEESTTIATPQTAPYSVPENPDYDPNFGEEVDQGVQNDEDDYDDDEGEEEEIQEKVSIETQPQTIVADQNNRVALPCHITGPSGLVTMWRKNNGPLFQDTIALTGNRGLSIENDNTLIINHATGADSGSYRCEVLGENMTVTHQVFVKSAPYNISVQAEGNGAELKSGDTLILKCTAEGYPKPSFKWYKLNGSVSLGSQGEILTIPDVKHKDAGTYRCLADNGIDPPAHGVINVDIEHKPVITAEKILVNSDESISADLRCTVHAHPAASVTWQKDGRNVIRSENRILLNDGNVHILKIKNIRSSDDFGTYVCFAKNHVGSSEKSISLLSTPAILEFIPPKEGGKHANLTWKVESVEPIEEFEIKYRKSNADSWKTEAVDTEDIEEEAGIYTITKSLPALESGRYVVKARAKDSNDYSEWTEEYAFERANKKHGHHKHQRKEHKESKKHNEAQPKQTEEPQSNTERSSSSSSTSTHINTERTSQQSNTENTSTQGNTDKTTRRSKTERTTQRGYTDKTTQRDFVLKNKVKSTTEGKKEIEAKIGGLTQPSQSGTGSSSAAVSALSLLLLLMTMLLHRC